MVEKASSATEAEAKMSGCVIRSSVEECAILVTKTHVDHDRIAVVIIEWSIICVSMNTGTIGHVSELCVGG